MAKKTEITITRYKIDKCGYYKPHAKGTPYFFGNVDGVLKSLLTWSNGKNLSETKTYEGSDEQLPTYLFDIHKHQTDYVICTWNESHSFNGQVLSVSPTELVGTKEVSGLDLPKGNIAGYPSYFWFRPKNNEFFTIQLPSALNGRINLNTYLQAYIKKFDPEHVVANKNLDLDAEAHSEVQGYRESQGAKIYSLEELAGFFESSLLRKVGGTESEIESNRRNIYKIVRKETLKTNVKTDDSIVKKMLSGIGLASLESNHTTFDYRVKYEVDFRPSESELKQIVENWKPDAKDTWDDIGFKITGQNTPLWLSSSIDRERVEVEIEQTKEGIVNLPSLINELQKLNIE